MPESDNSRHTLIVKFRTNDRPDSLTKRIREIVGQDSIKDAGQLFPGDGEAEFASMYQVELSDDASMTEAIESLKKDSTVEYAHEPSSREAR